MKKRIISMLLVFVMMLGLLPTMALAASSEEETLGEVDIYNEGTKLSYLSINGRVRELIYTYYNFVRKDGSSKEVPAYCVNPNIYGVPQTVPKGQSIKYLAKEKSSDPKIMGIVANGYPTRGLSELKLQDKYEAYYATKMALWAYILPNWSISNLKVNPALSGDQLTRAKAVLAAAKDIYTRGTVWSEVYAPSVTCTPDCDVAYDVTIGGRAYTAAAQEPRDLRVQDSEMSAPRTAEAAALEPQKMPLSKKEKRKIDHSQIKVSPSCPASARDGLTDEEREADFLDILDACELDSFSPETALVFENAIERLYYSDSYRIGNATLPQSRVRAKLRRLDGMILREVEYKLRENREENVKNSTAYTMAVLFNCIAESESDLMIDPYLNSLCSTA